MSRPGRAGHARRRWHAVAITLALLLLAGCGAGGDGRSTTGVSSAGSGRAVLASPATGELDEFTWALPFEAASLDPIKSWSYPENTILANLCESVVHLTPDLKLEPGLASKVDTSDPTKVVLTIRDGVRFWDGSPMTAQDVAFSLNRNLRPISAATSTPSGATWARSPRPVLRK